MIRIEIPDGKVVIFTKVLEIGLHHASVSGSDRRMMAKWIDDAREAKRVNLEMVKKACGEREVMFDESKHTKKANSDRTR